MRDPLRLGKTTSLIFFQSRPYRCTAVRIRSSCESESVCIDHWSLCVRAFSIIRNPGIFLFLRIIPRIGEAYIFRSPVTSIEGWINRVLPPLCTFCLDLSIISSCTLSNTHGRRSESRLFAILESTCRPGESFTSSMPADGGAVPEAVHVYTGLQSIIFVWFP